MARKKKARKTATRNRRRLSPATRAKLRRQARINFGLTKKRKRRVGQVARRKARRRSYRRNSYGKKLDMGLLVGAGVYGAGRNVVSAALAPITSKIPLGTIADELVLAFLGHQVKRRTTGILREVGNAAMVVEAARIGVAVADGSAFQTGASSSGVGSALQPNTFV